MDASGQDYANQLIERARNRALSEQEARCLALEAAKALPGWDGPNATISVRPVPDSFLGLKLFTATRISSVQPSEIGRLLTVNLSTAMVLDEETGLNIASSGLGGLVSKMIALREPLWLTHEDAATVALQIPRMRQALQGGCPVYAGGAFQSTESIVGISCQGLRPEKSPYVSVNLQTGEVTDAVTGKSLATPESARLASELVAAQKRRRTALQGDLEQACRP